MNKLGVVLLLLLCAVVSAIAGGAAGYYVALTTPVASPIAVIDIEGMASRLDTNAPDYQQRMVAISNQARAMTQRLTASGVIVLDRAQVIGAPEEAILRVDTIK